MNAKYEIRKATYEEIPMIMRYIDEDWKKGHIMSTSREMFEYEFVDENKQVNMFILYDSNNDRIDGCQGYIKSALGEKEFDTWGSIFKVREGCRGFHGIALEKAIQSIEGNRFYLGIGQNPNTSVKIFQKLFKENAARMKHYYRIAEREEYKIAIINHKKQNSLICERKDYIITQYHDENQFVKSIEELDLKAYNPYKNKEYLVHRYFRHPVYQYHTFGIYYKDNLEAIFVIRYQPYCGRVAIRFVDFIGNEHSIEALNGFCDDLFKNREIEYADFYEYGFQERNMEKAGFLLLEDGDTNIIPNYFAPFVRENVDIWVTWPQNLKLKFCKADGDQDRPNAVFAV